MRRPPLPRSVAPPRQTALPIRRGRASIGDESPGCSMRPSLLNPLFAADHDAARRRLRAREALPSAVRPRGGGARRRSPVSSADRRDRPPRAAEAARRRARHRRHRRGHRRPAPAAAAAPAARALSDLCQRRDRRPHPDLSSTRARTICRSCCRSASGATCRARSRSTTTCCRWCIPTASSPRRIWRSCRWSSRSIR